MADVFAEAFLGIRPELSDDFDQQVKDKIEQPVKNAEKNVQQSARNMARAFVLAFGAREIVQFGKQAFTAFAESESASLRLQATFEDQRKLQDATTESIERLAAATMEKTRFDDDAVLSSAALLAQFRLTEGQITTLLPLVIDLAARTGRDLEQSASSAGKAILGQGRALKEVGIDFEDAGSRTANFEQLVRGLREQVGGFAEREGKSAAGQAARLGVAMGELQEGLGEVISEGLGPLITFGADAITMFLALPDPVKDVANAAIVLVGGLTLLNLGLKATQAGLAAVGVEATLANPALLKTVGGVAGITAAIAVGAPILGDFVNNLIGIKSAAEVASEWEAYLADQIKTQAMTTGEAYVQLRRFNELLGHLPAGLQLSAEAIGLTAARSEEATEMVDGYAGALGDAADKAKTAAEATRDLLSAQLELAGSFLGVESAQRSAAEAEAALESATARLNRLREDGAEGTDRYREALKEQNDAEIESLESRLAYTGAIESYIRQLDEGEASQKQVIALLREQADKAGLSRDATDQLIESVRGVTRGLDRFVVTSDEVGPAFDILIDGFGLTAQEAANARSAVDGFVGAMGRVPGGGTTGDTRGNNRPRGNRDPDPQPVVPGATRVPQTAIVVDGRVFELAQGNRRRKVGGF